VCRKTQKVEKHCPSVLSSLFWPWFLLFIWDVYTPLLNKFDVVHDNPLIQGAQTRGPRATCSPREGLMRPANIRKKSRFERKNWVIFYQINWFLTHNSKNLFSCGPRDLTLSLMRPASPLEFETPALIQSSNRLISMNRREI